MEVFFHEPEIIQPRQRTSSDNVEKIHLISIKIQYFE